MPLSDNISGSFSYPDVDQPSCQLLGPTALVIIHLLYYAASTISFPDRARPTGHFCALIFSIQEASRNTQTSVENMVCLLSQGHPRRTHYLPRRLFDVSKQVVGQMFVHGANLLAAGLVSHHTDGNACVNYFLNILIDTTFGELHRVPPHLPLQYLTSF